MPLRDRFFIVGLDSDAIELQWIKMYVRTKIGVFYRYPRVLASPRHKEVAG